MKMTTTVADGLLTSGCNAITLMRRDYGKFRRVKYPQPTVVSSVVNCFITLLTP